MGIKMDDQMMDALSTRERRHLRTHAAILDAARQIISRKGVDALSMRAIARAIDHSPAGLYEYFGSKEEIIAAVCRQGHRRLTEYMQRADRSLPAADYLMEIGLAYIDFAVRNPDFFRLMFTDPNTGIPQGLGVDDALAEMTQEGSSFGLLLAAVQRGIDEGLYQTKPGYELLEIAFGTWSIVHGMAMLRIGHLANFPLNFAPVEEETLRRFGIGQAMA